MGETSKRSLGEIMTLHRGYDLPSSLRSDGCYPVISSSGISDYHSDYKVDGPNVVTGRYGTIGKVTYYDGPCWPLNTTLYVSDFHNNHPRYVSYLLEATLAAMPIDGTDKSTVPGVDRNVLHLMKVPFVEQGDQARIVAILSALDNKIANNRKLMTELEETARLIYDYWFTQFDFPDENGNPYRSSGGKMVYNETLHREIPAGWMVLPIQECCNVVDCLHSKKPESTYESENSFLLQLNNLADLGMIDLDYKYYVSDSDYQEWTSRILIREGDMVITNAGRVGGMARIPANLETGMGRNMTAIRPGSIPAHFVWYFFQSPEMQRQIAGNTDSGSFFQSLNVAGIKQLKFVIPSQKSHAILERFETTVSPLRTQAESLQNENLVLSNLRDWLLPMLMNGQAVVS